MKLGKALATGVAEEAPRIRDSRDDHGSRDVRDEGLGTVQEITDVVQVSPPEEVPAAR